jgi:endonuclease/exonuclease/phosphatase family metal-dependent hydrolase
MIRNRTTYRITTLVILIVAAGVLFFPWQSPLSSSEKTISQETPDNPPIVVANDPKPSTLTILTWNLEWFFDHDPTDNVSDLSKKLSAPSLVDWEWKVQVVAETISQIKPSIMGLQEVENRRVLDDLVRHLKEKHGLSYRIAFIEGFDRATEQEVGILYRNGLVEFSRLEQSGPMFRSNQFYNLSKHIVARFRWGDGDDSEELVVVNVHLRARTEEAELRQRQCKLLRHWLQDLRRHTANVIIMGDLNTDELAGHVNSGSDIHGLLAGPTNSPEDDLHDLLENAPVAKRQTHLLLNKQFDRILASQALMKDRPGNNLAFENIKVLSELNIRGAGVDPGEDHWEAYWKIDPQERDISDHHPVVAEFSFNR